MKQIGWGIIGCGSVAERKGGPALYKARDSRLVAVMSRDAAKARSFAERHGAARYYTSVEALLKDDEVAAVYVATPPALHAEMTIQAANAGKHVLCEKPMALNSAECRRMIAACREKRVQLMIAYYRRTYPVIRKVKEILNTDTIGEMVYSRVLTASRYSGDPTWRTDPKIAGGGFMVDIGSHRLDLVADLFGLPVQVHGFVETRFFDIAVDDSASVHMRFGNGMPAIAQFFWSMATSVDEFEIGGTAGRLLVRNLEKGELQVVTKSGVEEYLLPRPPITHLALVENFVESILSGRPNMLPGEEGIKATLIMEAASKGGVVSLDSGCEGI